MFWTLKLYFFTKQYLFGQLCIVSRVLETSCQVSKIDPDTQKCLLLLLARSTWLFKAFQAISDCMKWFWRKFDDFQDLCISITPYWPNGDNKTTISLNFWSLSYIFEYFPTLFKSFTRWASTRISPVANTSI